MLYLGVRVYIVSPRERLKTKEDYQLAVRKVMNSGPQLVHLHVTEEQDYALDWTLGNTNVLYAKPKTSIFSLTVVMQLFLSV